MKYQKRKYINIIGNRKRKLVFAQRLSRAQTKFFSTKILKNNLNFNTDKEYNKKIINIQNLPEVRINPLKGNLLINKKQQHRDYTLKPFFVIDILKQNKLKQKRQIVKKTQNI